MAWGDAWGETIWGSGANAQPVSPSVENGLELGFLLGHHGPIEGAEIYADPWQAPVAKRAAVSPTGGEFAPAQLNHSPDPTAGDALGNHGGLELERKYRPIYIPTAPAVPIDNGIYFPETVAQYSALGLPSPSHILLLQEASGALQDELTAEEMPANAGGGLYQQTVAPYTRKKIVCQDGNASFWVTGTSHAFSAGTESAAYYLVMDLHATPGATDFIRTGSTANRVSWRAAGSFRHRVNGGSTYGSQDHSGEPAGTPILMVHNRATGAGELYSRKEYRAGGTPTNVTSAVSLGASDGSMAGDMGYLYLAIFKGAAAEALDKTFLEALGWVLEY